MHRRPAKSTGGSMATVVLVLLLMSSALKGAAAGSDTARRQDHVASSKIPGCSLDFAGQHGDSTLSRIKACTELLMKRQTNVNQATESMDHGLEALSEYFKMLQDSRKDRLEKSVNGWEALADLATEIADSSKGIRMALELQSSTHELTRRNLNIIKDALKLQEYIRILQQNLAVSST